MKSNPGDDTMSQPNKPRARVKVYHVFPLHPSEAGPGQLTLEQFKKIASSRPLRRPEPRKAPESDTNSNDKAGGQ
jgi:hypothetical protein